MYAYNNYVCVQQLFTRTAIMYAYNNVCVKRRTCAHLRVHPQAHPRAYASCCLEKCIAPPWKKLKWRPWNRCHPMGALDYRCKTIWFLKPCSQFTVRFWAFSMTRLFDVGYCRVLQRWCSSFYLKFDKTCWLSYMLLDRYSNIVVILQR